MTSYLDIHLLLQLAIFSYAFSDFISRNGGKFFNDSVQALLNLIKFLLFILVFVAAFHAFSWWFALLYVLVSYFVQQMVVGIIASQTIPLDFFEEKLRRGPAVGREKTAYILILCNHALMVIVVAILFLRVLF